ncbi:hypothetical protein [Enterococcus rivorum]|uniref:Uncharacterized protein n=1 Tax=Enterococcus rivorum TaxID=762845 RepID=A0A1E5L007_9ENTE|nr:hypothetical protein [Enterococcus rivorum]MBP2099217.1 ribosomal protein S1 [Enterococcus rivorum]OEH83404.1 hypothetical protein BCR26_10105 [Enterococcus rivorum]
MKKTEVKVGQAYLCHRPEFSWFFVGQAVLKKDKDVQVRVVKCHPADRANINSDNPILNIDYLSLIEDA